MTAGYVDTSCLVAVAFGERGSRALARRLQQYDTLVSSNLLEAELRSAMAREEAGDEAAMLGRISWVFPDRRLTQEIGRVLQAGCLRGADLWHLATALYLVESPGDLDFLTLDSAQAEVAASLGFPVPA